MLGSIGFPEIMIVMVIGLLVLGPRRLPEAGRGIGTGLREFKAAITGERSDDAQPALSHDHESAQDV